MNGPTAPNAQTPNAKKKMQKYGNGKIQKQRTLEIENTINTQKKTQKYESI